MYGRLIKISKDYNVPFEKVKEVFSNTLNIETTEFIIKTGFAPDRKSILFKLLEYILNFFRKTR